MEETFEMSLEIKIQKFGPLKCGLILHSMRILKFNKRTSKTNNHIKHENLNVCNYSTLCLPFDRL